MVSFNMIWKNLKENKCPQCNKNLNWNRVGYLDCSCGFMIRNTRAEEIIGSQITKELEDKWNRDIEADVV